MVVLGRSKSVAVILWISFFTLRACGQYFLHKSFTMTRPCLPTRWHVSMSFAGTSIPTFSKILEKVSSNSLAGTLWGVPATSTHSHLEYWALARHCLSMLTRRSDNSSLMYLDRASSPSSFFTHSFNSLTSSRHVELIRFSPGDSLKILLVLVLKVCWVILLIVLPWLKTANKLEYKVKG